MQFSIPCVMTAAHREVAVDELELSIRSIEEANVLTEREDGPRS